MVHRMLCLDPGFGFIGAAVLNVVKNGPMLVYMDVFQTDKSDTKRKVLASDDNLRRATEIHKYLLGLIETYKISVVSAESMSFPRNASAAAKVAMTWGVVAALVDRFKLPLLQASPQEVKKAVCGKKDASKQEVEDALRTTWPKAFLPEGLAKSKHNHAWDALAVGVTCFNSPVVQAIQKTMES